MKGMQNERYEKKKKRKKKKKKKKREGEKKRNFKKRKKEGTKEGGEKNKKKTIYYLSTHTLSFVRTITERIACIIELSDRIRSRVGSQLFAEPQNQPFY